LTGSKHSSRLSAGVYIAILAATACIASLSDDPILIMACGLAIVITIRLLWRMGEVPALLMAAGLQLSQVIVLPMYASLSGVPLQDVSFNDADVTLATWFALVALMSLVAGMWCGHLGARPSVSAMRLEVAAWSPRAAFFFCVATMLLSAAFGALNAFEPGLRQPLIAAGRVEWAGVFVLAYVCVAQRRGWGYLLLVASFEFFKGFGFFADFKEIFIVLLVSVAAAKPRLRPSTVLTCLLLAGIVLPLGAFWSAIKIEYRGYISGGAWGQTVLVPLDERLGYLMNGALKADGEMMLSGFDAMARRWGYVDLLSATMRNVPAQVPFENGALIGGVVMHVLQPRLLFPGKPPVPNDTERAVQYSGIGFNEGGNAEDTSISLGYVAELYVDFGIVGTLVAMFILGFLCGRAVRYLTASTTLPAIVSSGLAMVLMMSMASFEQALPKMIGAAITTFIVILALRSYFLPFLLRMLGPIAAAKLGGELPKAARRMAAGR
jgi:O-antigen polysaccharide polymerase Wzy